MPKQTPNVFLAMPSYDGWLYAQTAMAAYLYPTQNRCRVMPTFSMNSLLCHGFNGLWCEALNRRRENGITHFAMLHSDVVPARFWLDTLLERMPKGGLISAVIPIKSDRGHTSTALDLAPEPWMVPKRLTMREIMALPETFSAADCGWPYRALLVNTGCWVCDFREPWVEEVGFTITDTIMRTPEGKFRASAEPEDWDFSRQLHKLGVPVCATRAVKIDHVGQQTFSNDSPWGEWAEDEIFKAQEKWLAEQAAQLQPVA